MSLRTRKTEIEYSRAKVAKTLVPLGSEAKIPEAPDFQYWKIVANRFPHDQHHTHHVLVVLKRDCPVESVTLEEIEEMWYRILPWADDHFDYLKFNLRELRSIHATPHLHLLVLKEEYK